MIKQAAKPIGWMALGAFILFMFTGNVIENTFGSQPHRDNTTAAAKEWFTLNVPHTLIYDCPDSSLGKAVDTCQYILSLSYRLAMGFPTHKWSMDYTFQGGYGPSEMWVDSMFCKVFDAQDIVFDSTFADIPEYEYESLFEESETD